MASPTPGDVHVNVPLSMLSIAYLQKESAFAAGSVFPNVPVQKQTDIYWEYPRDVWFRDDSAERALNAESAGTDYQLQHTSTYNCKVYAIHNDIPDRVMANADAGIDLDRNAVELITRQLLLRKERTFISNFFTTGIWTGGPSATDMTGSSTPSGNNQFKQWDLAGSNPIEDIKKQALNVLEITGYKPNTLILGPRVARALEDNPEIIDRVKYTQPGFIPPELLATAFEVDRVIVPTATRNTATEGATRTMSLMYGLSALLVYAAPSPALLSPSGGYTFSWQGYINGSMTAQIKRFYIPEKETTRVEGQMAFDMKLIGSDLGVFFTSATSA